MPFVFSSFCLSLDTQLGKGTWGAALELMCLLSDQPVLSSTEITGGGGLEPACVIGDLILKTAYLPVVISDTSLKTAGAAQDSCCAARPHSRTPCHTPASLREGRRVLSPW